MAPMDNRELLPEGVVLGVIRGGEMNTRRLKACMVLVAFGATVSLAAEPEPSKEDLVRELERENSRYVVPLESRSH